jgi:hypothetical protein
MNVFRALCCGVLGATAFFVLGCFFPLRADAASMTLYPDRGYALLTKPFAVDIMLDTGSEDVMEARAVFRFDPTRVQVTKAEYADLFCQYPEDQYAVDNTAGWIKLTGYCNDPYYNSDGTPGLFGRFTFEPIMEGTVEFEFIDSYDDEDWISHLLDTSSPPQEITGVQYTGGTYAVVSSVGPVDGGNGDGTRTKLPGVGIFDDKRVLLGAVLLGGSVLVVVGERMIRARRKSGNDQGGTVVVKSR